MSEQLRVGVIGASWYADGGVLDPTNDSAMLAIEFVNGTQGLMQLSTLAYIGTRGMDQRITLHGESGTLKTSATFRGAEIRGARASESGELKARDTFTSAEIRGERDSKEETHEQNCKRSIVGSIDIGP